MTFTELKQTIPTPYFYRYQLPRFFPSESRQQLNTQLYRWANQGKIIRLKQGLYLFAGIDINDFVVSNLLYRPSYVSLESVLNNHGMIPDVPWATTAVNPMTSKTYQSKLGRFSYHKLKPDLFYGFRLVSDEQSGLEYRVAEPEKALLDWLYVNQTSTLDAIRLDKTQLNLERLQYLGQAFPDWVQTTINQGFYE